MEETEAYFRRTDDTSTLHIANSILNWNRIHCHHVLLTPTKQTKGIDISASFMYHMLTSPRSTSHKPKTHFIINNRPVHHLHINHKTPSHPGTKWKQCHPIIAPSISKPLLIVLPASTLPWFTRSSSLSCGEKLRSLCPVLLVSVLWPLDMPLELRGRKARPSCDRSFGGNRPGPANAA